MSRGIPRLCHRVYRNLHIKRKQLILCVLSLCENLLFHAKTKARKEIVEGFTRRRKARKGVVKGFTRRRKARKGEVKGSRKAEVGAGLAPALFYFTESGRTQEKVVEFARRRKARKERVKGFTRRQSTQRKSKGFHAKAQSTQRNNNRFLTRTKHKENS